MCQVKLLKVTSKCSNL